MKRRDEVQVGILITVAMIVVVIGALYLAQGSLRSGYPLYGRFQWGQNLKQGQPVLLAGVTIGYVADVNIRDDGFLDVEMRVNDDRRVPKTVAAEVIPVGIFGDAAVAFKATMPSRDSYAAGDTVPTKLTSSGLDALTARADTISASLARITTTLEQQFVGEGGISDVRQSVTLMRRVTSTMEGVLAEQNRNLTSTLEAFRSTAKGMDSAQIATTLATMRLTAANADTLMQRLSSNTTQIQALLARLERGEGSAGRLLADTTLYTNLRNLVASADSLMIDFKKNPRKYINLSIF
jgi:phospholipid/cholesterol/gamma-HCH transport system substrate-binding protein